MKVDIRKQGSTLIAQVAGEMDLHTSEAFRLAIDPAMASLAVKNLILVLTNVSFIDSSGVGAILGRYRTVKERQGRMVLVGLCPAVKRVLDTAGVLQITEIADSERRALARL